MTPDVQRLIEQAAAQYNLPVDVFTRLIGRESNFNQSAVSPAGAIGLGQLMPGTAAGLGVDPHDPAQNIQGAGMYLRQMLNQFGGDWDKALAAYNWGPGNVSRLGLGQAPQETRNYVAALRPGGGGPFSSGPVSLPSGPVKPNYPPPGPITMPDVPPAPQGPPPGMLASLITSPLADQLKRISQQTAGMNQIG